MTRVIHPLGNCRIEILTDASGDTLRGLGALWIGTMQVRSGRLPLAPIIQTFGGLELARQELLGVDAAPHELRLRTRVHFRRLTTRPMRDHSFDPIHDLTDWDSAAVADTARLDLVLQPAARAINGRRFHGLRYWYEYRSDTVPIYWLLDRGTWELDGDIGGATVYNQSSCSAPVVTFAPDTAWSTEGILHFSEELRRQNPVMTHNLPRWASHQAFDHQWRGDHTLLGIFEHVALIRSLLCREPGKPELKVFDKHLFDEALRQDTTPKQILLNADPKTATDQRNLWTWALQEVHAAARAEFGLAEELPQIRVSHNYWVNFDLAKYYTDLLPAARAIGAESVFIDNVNKSAMTEPGGLGNMCCGHEYEPAPKLGGEAALARFVQDCREAGIEVYSWTNNDQAYSSPLNHNNRDTAPWYVRMEDARLKYGGAYTNVFAILDFGRAAPRRYWVDCLKQIRARTGLSAYLFDSFYNLGFMPINYADCRPATIWRGTLQAMKELQDAGVHFMIESFGPFGEVQHGCPASYNLANLFACYQANLGTGYTTIPSGQEQPRPAPWPAPDYYRILAHGTKAGHPLFYAGQRIDRLFTPAHRQAISDFKAARPHMHRRYLQPDDQAVLWHAADGCHAVIWNFARRAVTLPGHLRDLSTGHDLAPDPRRELAACHTYLLNHCSELPELLI